MKIAVIGRGNVGGGLADLWEGAGHELQRIGQEGGDVCLNRWPAGLGTLKLALALRRAVAFWASRQRTTTRVFFG